MASRLSSISNILASSGGLGFGCSGIGNLYKPVSDQKAWETIDESWARGVRYFDTAPFYGMGLSEQRLGQALRGKPRQDYLISTKVGRLLTPTEGPLDQYGFVRTLPYKPHFDYSYDGVMKSFESSLQRLGTERIDILYMHDIGRLTHGAMHEDHLAAARGGGMRALQLLKEQRVVTAIGLGVNEIEICREFMGFCDLDILMVAGRYTLLDHEPLAAFFNECMSRQVSVVAAGIFNSGILATGAATSTPYYDYAPAPEDIVARVTSIETICRRYEVPLAAAAIQFVLAHPAVTAAVIGTASPKRLAQTCELARSSIPPAFWSAMVEARLLPRNAPLP